VVLHRGTGKPHPKTPPSRAQTGTALGVSFGFRRLPVFCEDTNRIAVNKLSDFAERQIVVVTVFSCR
jgi:hypothetical protein